jgi:hypothetical protein
MVAVVVVVEEEKHSLDKMMNYSVEMKDDEMNVAYHRIRQDWTVAVVVDLLMTYFVVIAVDKVLQDQCSDLMKTEVKMRMVVVEN